MRRCRFPSDEWQCFRRVEPTRRWELQWLRVVSDGRLLGSFRPNQILLSPLAAAVADFWPPPGRSKGSRPASSSARGRGAGSRGRAPARVAAGGFAQEAAAASEEDAAASVEEEEPHREEGGMRALAAAAGAAPVAE